MITTYFTDTVTLITTTFDDWNRPVETTSSKKARVDKTDKIIEGVDGQIIRGQFLIFLQSGTSVAIGDRISIDTLRGVATGDGREYIVRSVFKAGGFSPSHVEVMV